MYVCMGARRGGWSRPIVDGPEAATSPVANSRLRPGPGIGARGSGLCGPAGHRPCPAQAGRARPDARSQLHAPRAALPCQPRAESLLTGAARLAGGPPQAPGIMDSPIRVMDSRIRVMDACSPWAMNTCRPRVPAGRCHGPEACTADVWRRKSES